MPAPKTRTTARGATVVRSLAATSDGTPSDALHGAATDLEFAANRVKAIAWSLTTLVDSGVSPRDGDFLSAVVMLSEKLDEISEDMRQASDGAYAVCHTVRKAS